MTLIIFAVKVLLPNVLFLMNSVFIFININSAWIKEENMFSEAVIKS